MLTNFAIIFAMWEFEMVPDHYCHYFVYEGSGYIVTKILLLLLLLPFTQVHRCTGMH